MILGLWDGHDAGVACVHEGRVVYAANEERFSRRKLDVGFPRRALAEALEYAGSPEAVVIPTTDPSKLLSRLVPAAGESYYRHRRHKSAPTAWDDFKRGFKLAATQLPPFRGGAAVTAFLASLRGRFGRIPIRTCDHHHAHLASAFFTSGFERALVISLDGIGDGASGAVAVGDSAGLREIARFSGRDSIGLIYEEATRLLHMRELEDEGKVMALASYADLDEDAKSALFDLIAVSVEDGRIRLTSALRPRARLKDLLWRTGPERFAAAVQAFAEKKVLEIVEAARSITGEKNLAVAGGVFANVKINRLIRERFYSDGAGSFRVFPHMGDGGIALGAALGAAARIDPYTGTPVSADRAEEIARARGLRVDPATPDSVAQMLLRGEAIGWIAGRMEFGPRALGARSILARPDDVGIRDKLNMVQKRRVFYQPFCPTILRREAERSLEGYRGADERWMTSLYGVNAEGRKRLAGVIGPDGSCRPQILPENPSTPEERLFSRVIEAVDARLGIAAVLNTSFNIHGDPIVRTEEDAIDALVSSGLDALVVEGRIEIRVPRA